MSLFNFLRLWLVFFATSFLSIHATALAPEAPIIIAPAGSASVDIAPGVHAFIDITNTLAVADVSTANFANSFKTMDVAFSKAHQIKDPVWLRFTVRKSANDAGAKVLRLSYAHAKSVTLYRPSSQAAGEFVPSYGGTSTKVSQREIPDRLMTYPLYQPADSTVTYYVRYQDDAVVAPQFELWDSAVLDKQIITEYAVFGALYGALLILAFYALIIATKARLIVYGSYAVYVATLVFFIAILNGVLNLFAWPENPALSPILGNFGIAIVTTGVLYFTRTFLCTQENVAALDMWLSRLHLFGVTLTCCTVAAWFMPFVVMYWTCVVFATLSVCIIFIVGTYCAFRLHMRAGWFFFFAFCVTFVGVVLLLLRSFGLIPVSTATEYGLQIGVLVEVMVLIVGLADHVANLRRDEEVAHRSALTDSLTGLGNRAAMLQKLPLMLNHAQSLNAQVGLIMIDLDNFKPINDHYGHSTGDDLLCALAANLRSLLTPQELVIRLGGDEFLVAVNMASNVVPLALLAEQIRDCISKPTRLTVRAGPNITAPRNAQGEIQLAVTCSVGIATWHCKGRRHEPGSEADVLDLLHAADDAMYKSKKAGKNKVHELLKTLPARMNAALVQ
jgi:two-component system, sensor histidine kinase LadS